MKITKVSATDKNVEAFEKNEWKIEDLKRYGRVVDWSEWQPNFFIFKAEKEGKVVGVIGGHSIAGVMFIERILVMSSERNKGIGKMLLLKAEEYAKEINSHKIYLYTGKDWPANQFYLKHGYEKTGELARHFMKKDFVIYSKYI